MKYLMYAFVAVAPFVISCGDDDDNSEMELESKTFALDELNDSGVMGTAVFTKVNDSTTNVLVTVEGTEDGNMHPIHIHEGEPEDGGGVVVALTDVDGATGISETEVTMLSGEPVTYEQLIAYDGYINIHKSADEIATLVAQGDLN